MGWTSNEQAPPIIVDRTTSYYEVPGPHLVYTDKLNLPIEEIIKIPREKWTLYEKGHMINHSKGENFYEEIKIISRNGEHLDLFMDNYGFESTDYFTTSIFEVSGNKIDQLKIKSIHSAVEFNLEKEKLVILKSQFKKSFSGLGRTFRVYQKDEYHRRWTFIYKSWSLFLGLALSIMIYNIGMFIFFKEKYFLFYVFYVFGAITPTLVLNGMFPNSWTLWQSGLLIAAAALFLFKRSALNLSTFPRLNKFYTASFMFAFIASMPALAGIYFPLLGLLVGTFILANVIVSITVLLNGYKPAIFFIIGWSFAFCGMAIQVLNDKFFKLSSLGGAFNIGVGLEFILFSFAAGYKIRLNELETTKQNSHAFSQLRKVFYPHQIKAIRAGQTIEGTLPVGQGEACVIAFDVIGSSKINHEYFRETLEAFFARCRLIMLKNYDDEKLTANAFMIKEMGDGFLCSIGFPFKPPEKSKTAHAVRLAERFVKEFTNFMIDLQLKNPVYCAAGISLGQVEGMFSTEGVVRYDLFGQAVVMATRYESMRKQVFSKFKIVPSNIIILQERVFDSLPPEMREEYLDLNLKKAKLIVKDDEKAERLYFSGVAYQKTEEVESAS